MSSPARKILGWWCMAMALAVVAVVGKAKLGESKAERQYEAWRAGIPAPAVTGNGRVEQYTPTPRRQPPATPTPGGKLAWPPSLDVSTHKAEMRLRMGSVADEHPGLKLLELNCDEYPCFVVFEMRDCPSTWEPEMVLGAVRGEVPDAWPGQGSSRDAGGYISQWVGVIGLLLEPLRGQAALDRAGQRQLALIKKYQD